MRARQSLGVVLLLFAAVGVGTVIWRMNGSGKQEGRQEIQNEKQAGVAKAPAAAETPREVQIYYFHGNKRCVSCLEIEQRLKESLDAVFSKEMEHGDVAMRLVNLDKKANQHFVKKYALDIRTVVLQSTREGQEGRFERLDDVWKLHGDKDAFRKYVTEHLTVFLALGNG